MNKKRVVILLLLLVLVVALLFFLYRRPQAAVPEAAIQGETILNAGKISMRVWDNEAEDGDTIVLYFNNKLVADSLAILNSPDTFRVGEVQRGEYLLVVKAISEGMNAPASATVSLSDGKEEKEFVMDAYIDSAAAWKVIVR